MADPETMPDVVERLGWHHEHPVTGKMVLRNPDGPEAAAAITRLRTELASERERAEKAEEFAGAWHREVQVIATLTGAQEPEAGSTPVAVQVFAAERDALRARVETLEGVLRKALPVVDRYAFDTFSDEGKLARGLLPVIEAVILPEDDNRPTALKESPDHE